MSTTDNPSAALPGESSFWPLLGKATIILAGLAVGAAIGFILALRLDWILEVC